MQTGVFRIDPSTTLLENIDYHPSPNCDDRPHRKINLLVIHGISLPPGEFGGSDIDALFLNRLNPAAHPYFQKIAELRVSTHVLIRREGNLIQYVPFAKRAWHAGKSIFRGQENCNDFSIGIELEGTDEIPYTKAQYQRLAVVTNTLREYYPAITLDRIVGHSDVAPGRKTDPGPAFNWDYYRELIK